MPVRIMHAVLFVCPLPLWKLHASQRSFLWISSNFLEPS